MSEKTTQVFGPFEVESLFGKRPAKKPLQRPLPEAQIMELQHAGRNYGKCPYKAGDLVMPRGNSAYHGDGEPHLVLEVLVESMLQSQGQDASSPYYGARLDMRVLMLDEVNGRFCTAAYWVESWYFEPYEEGQK